MSLNLYQCEEKAKAVGYDSMKFLAIFPNGPRECQWLDAYMGLFKIDGLDGFVTTRQIDEQIPDLICIPMADS